MGGVSSYYLFLEGVVEVISCFSSFLTLYFQMLMFTSSPSIWGVVSSWFVIA